MSFAAAISLLLEKFVLEAIEILIQYATTAAFHLVSEERDRTIGKRILGGLSATRP